MLLFFAEYGNNSKLGSRNLGMAKTIAYDEFKLNSFPRVVL